MTLEGCVCVYMPGLDGYQQANGKIYVLITQLIKFNLTPLFISKLECIETNVFEYSSYLTLLFHSRGANLLAVNADGNMPYDICEDDATLDYIEGEMASRGVTQTLIDDTRSATETHMLNHLKMMKSQGQSLMFRDHQGATPVSTLHFLFSTGFMMSSLLW